MYHADDPKFLLAYRQAKAVLKLEHPLESLCSKEMVTSERAATFTAQRSH